MTPWVAPFVFFVVAVGFELFCLAAVLRTPTVRHLPRWGWAALCVLCNPLGGLAFLTIGWPRRPPRNRASRTATEQDAPGGSSARTATRARVR